MYSQNRFPELFFLQSLQKRHDIHESILSVNAIDGSILNDLLGY